MSKLFFSSGGSEVPNLESAKEPKVSLTFTCYSPLFTITITTFLIIIFYAAVMETDGFELLKENCPLLQSELLKTVAGTEEELSGGGKSRSVWAQFSDGGDTTDRRRHNWEDVGERGQSLWVQSSDGGDARGMSPGQEG